MKKFTFRLEAVLEVKKKREEQIQIELGIVLQQLQKIKDLQEEYRNKQIYYLEEIDRIKAKLQHINDILPRQQYVESLDLQIRRLDLDIEQKQEEVDEVRQRLITAAKEKKIMEKMKEKERQAYMKEIRSKELSFLDEIGVLKEARKMVAMTCFL